MASVFLIEDDQAIRQTLVRSLSEQGHTVKAVSTGADALRVTRITVRTVTCIGARAPR